LPDEVHGHYGATLKSDVLYQYYHQPVTQPLLREQLQALGIEISAGQLNHLLSEDPEAFHAEKAQVLEAGRSPITSRPMTPGRAIRGAMAIARTSAMSCSRGFERTEEPRVG
jgi:hypothetical protein